MGTPGKLFDPGAPLLCRSIPYGSSGRRASDTAAWGGKCNAERLLCLICLNGTYSAPSICGVRKAFGCGASSRPAGADRSSVVRNIYYIGYTQMILKCLRCIFFPTWVASPPRPSFAEGRRYGSLVSPSLSPS